MITILPDYWKQFKEFSMKNSTYKEEEIKEKTDELVKEYKEKGYIKKLPLEAMNIDDAVICNFYLEIGKDKLKEKEFPSPVEKEENSSWMYLSDYCFINVRATGKEPDKTGNFINTLKLIPVLRANSIHLAPFFDCALDNIYAVDSLRIITKDVVCEKLLSADINADEQLKLLIDSIHILDKTAGFDLEPHTSQFSRIALENPHLFRWIRLTKKEKKLYGKVTQEEMLEEKSQEKIQKAVNKIVKDILKKHKLKTLEPKNASPEKIRKAHGEITNKLIENGYWTLPSHTWGGVGLPEYDFYNTSDNHPDFVYLNEKGEDHHEHSFGMLTPYKFYSNMPLNKIPEEDNLPITNKETVDYLKSVFPDLQDRYKFDFVRLDYVDHVFDSTFNESWNIPISDRMTPEVLQTILMASKEHRKYTGAMAERMGVDIGDYGKLGFDLILGNTMLSTMNKDYVKFNFDLQEQIEAINKEREIPASVLFAVDTHDTGHPLFWTVPLSEAVGGAGLHLRHFLSRFTWNGRGRRPKYEVIGNQDLSHGLYEANNKLKSVAWKGDKEYNDLYHGLEDTYERFKDLIFNSHLGPTYISDDCAFWFIDREDGYRERLLCVVALEKAFDKVKEVIKEKPVYEPVTEIMIDFLENYYFENPEIFEVNYLTGELTLPNRISHHQVSIKEIPPLGTKLYFIREQG